MLCTNEGSSRDRNTRFFFTRSCATAMPWDSVNKQSNPDDTWEIWKKLLMQIIDKYAPHLGLEPTIAIAAMFLQEPIHALGCRR